MADAQVKLGDTVDIVAGPFAGGHAVVKALASANGLLKVEMPVLGMRLTREQLDGRSWLQTFRLPSGRLMR
jgi:transcription antitermination factor NusG